MNLFIARFQLPSNQFVLSKIESTFSTSMHWVSGLGSRGQNSDPSLSHEIFFLNLICQIWEKQLTSFSKYFFPFQFPILRGCSQKRELSYINFGCTRLLVVIWKYQTWNFESLFNHGHCTKTRNICSIFFSWFFSASNDHTGWASACLATCSSCKTSLKAFLINHTKIIQI